jgi:hypothetical protein
MLMRDVMKGATDMAARSQFLLGGLAAVLALTGGLFLWQGLTQSDEEMPLPAPPPPLTALPKAGIDAPKFGAPPPALPEAKRASREEMRFNRYDRDRNERVSRIEMLGTRSAAFRKLDKDGNNLLTFEEWAAATSQRFAGADADKSGDLTRAEFATTAPKRAAAPACKC